MMKIDRQFFQKIAASVAIAGMMVIAIGDIVGAAERLNDGDSVNGVIRANSPTFRFRNQTRTGSPIQTATGEEYTFNAQQGDTIQISVDVEEGNLAPVLVLISSQNERQVAYDDTQNSLRYRVPADGEYRLLVLGQNNTRGRYTLSVSGISDNSVAQNPASPNADKRRQLLADEFGLRVLDNCPPATSSLVVVSFVESTQTYRYCASPNRVYRAGEYTYDAISGEIKTGAPVAQGSSSTNDAKRRILENEFGLRVLDNCPPATNSLVVVSFPESTQTYRYCANANRVYPAGEYTYDAVNGNLKRGTTVAGGSSSLNDSRRQILEDELGLRVLDTCPAATSSLVVVSFDESNQIYRYCANPNRNYPAGEYTYNTSTRNLQAGTPGRNSQRCAVSVAGVCVVK
ncbi:hypothetical protein [Aerosakkonema funiforme]|uniref:hypothetical protein n=1 Tax=Aerosakkonema funiforme TaxID=1246630 RepID=UPI0035B9E366